MAARVRGQMRFPNAGWSQKKDILRLWDEVAGGQIENVFAVDGRIKTPVEVFQCFQAAEVGGLGAAFHQPLLANVNFVLADQFQELGVAQACRELAFKRRLAVQTTRGNGFAKGNSQGWLAAVSGRPLSPRA
jgi:hypothetical protein